MKYGKIKGVNKEASRIFLGTAIPPFLNGKDCGELLDNAVALGINTIDTARVYGLSENVIGNWLEKRGRRDDLILLTKCCHPLGDGTKRVSAKCIFEDYETSRALLGTDYFDIYLMHRDDPDTAVSELVDAMNELHAKGKVGAFGGSNWTAKRIEEANEYAYKHGMEPFTVSSPYYSLADQIADPWGGSCVSIAGDENKAEREWYKKNGMPVVAYSSLAHGLLSGRIRTEEDALKLLDAPAQKGYLCKENLERVARCFELAEKKGCTVPQLAAAWLFASELDVFAVVASSDCGRMRENVKAIDIELTREERDWLDLK